MKAKLIKTIDGYHLRSLIKDIPRSINVYHKISKNEGEFGFGEHSGKLSKQNCDEIFGVVDVEKLAEESWGDKISSPYYSYIEGFNKATQLNKDKVFTLEDMRQAYNDGMNNIDGDGCSIDNPDEDFIDTINTIQQPSEIEVEIEMREDYLMWKHSDIEKMSDCLVPKLDSEGCLILKKI